ncbi:MAG TPA: 30S ribosomal protein S1 [Bacillota bacterium]|nr:30S ribosomal protein S1 [Clostridiales bacterium UBA9856]HOA43032.1 30S ribosomal protein S1 [Bacillota bacterium]HPZ59941.1 30S ribosomal protein S1 [Bacillota bacterium]HQC82699.1 30S ribosomal protein S1 [Bacillota bacterium]
MTQGIFRFSESGLAEWKSRFTDGLRILRTKEREKHMEENLTMADFMEEIEKSMKKVYKDDILKGTIIAVNEEEVLVNINHTSDGIIKKEEMVEGYDYCVGGEIAVQVIDPHDSEGNVLLSHKSAEEIVGWEDLEEAYNQKKTVRVKVTEVIKGGVSATYRNVRCFIPGSLLSYRYVEDMSSYVGKELDVVVDDFDRERKRAVLSRKAVEVAQRQDMKKQLMAELKVGETRQGVVTKLMKFGAFVDLGGVEGLIHLDDLAWHRVNDPAEVVSEGDQVTVYIANIDKKNNKIGLVLKKVEEDPWRGAADFYKVDDLVEGIVVRLADFGAFIEVEPGLQGLAHVSEITSKPIRKPSDVLKVGDSVQAVILSIDEENRKLSLSLKDAEGLAPDEAMPAQEESKTTLGDLFGDKLKELLKQ